MLIDLKYAIERCLKCPVRNIIFSDSKSNLQTLYLSLSLDSILSSDRERVLFNMVYIENDFKMVIFDIVCPAKMGKKVRNDPHGASHTRTMAHPIHSSLLVVSQLSAAHHLSLITSHHNRQPTDHISLLTVPAGGHPALLSCHLVDIQNRFTFHLVDIQKHSNINPARGASGNTIESVHFNRCMVPPTQGPCLTPSILHCW